MPEVVFPVGGTFGTFIVREAPGYISREQVVVANGAGNLPDGMVMAKKTSNGEWTPFVDGGADGAGAAKGILLGACDATAAAVRNTMLVRIAEVQRAALKFAGTPAAPARNTAYVGLAAADITLR